MKLACSLLTLFFPIIASSQHIQDSIKVELQPVEIKHYFNKQADIAVTASMHTVGRKTLEANQQISMTAAMNTVAGVRMEERSPGSYRLALRGSTIRSPFGIRNVKIYINDMPLTDAGGNTYLNVLDPYFLQEVQVIKGPDASIFAANSGGVIQIVTKQDDNTTDARISLGSYGFLQENVGISRRLTPKYNFTLQQGYTHYDGYRENSSVKRWAFQTAHQLKYNKDNHLNAYVLFSDLGYLTPGGLTAAQYADNPKAARPAAGSTPGAQEQKAGIYNKTLYGGISNTFHLTNGWKHFIATYGSYTDFENPFITNYEYRIEKNLGLRTYLSFQREDKPYEIQFGMEANKGWNSIDNYDNLQGVSGDMQASDKLDVFQMNIFSRIQYNLTSKWMIEGSLGWNKNKIHYQTLFPASVMTKGNIDFEDQLMPRLGSSFLLNNFSALRASLSKGYSTPTIAELRASDNLVNKDLQAETGINYEIGYKIKSRNGSKILDIAAYSYRMDNGIVRHINADGADYYGNAGHMKQRGLELSFWSFWNLKNSFFKTLQYHTAVTYNDYKFGNYVNGSNNYKGNAVTSVPKWTMSNTLELQLPQSTSLKINHFHISDIPLDDANTVFAKAYDLIQLQINWNFILSKLKSNHQLYLQIDNLLDQKYSLGNDINAFGGRYFNAAAPRSFVIGTKLTF